MQRLKAWRNSAPTAPSTERWSTDRVKLATVAMAPEKIGDRIARWRELIDPIVATEAWSETGHDAFAADTAAVAAP